MSTVKKTKNKHISDHKSQKHKKKHKIDIVDSDTELPHGSDNEFYSSQNSDYDNSTSIASTNSDNLDEDNEDNEDDEDDEDDEDSNKATSETTSISKKKKVGNNIETKKLKKRIHKWLDCDDKIKELNSSIKKLKDSKKEDENVIIKMIEALGIGDNKMDINDNNNQLRSRVYRQKSVTKGAIKEDIITNTLMEVFQNEKKVKQLIKKIDGNRPINEKYYLKRTKGNTTE